MNPTKLYMCYNCNTEHATKDKAVACCDPVIVDVYKCSECGVSYMSKSTAEKCCTDSEKNDSNKEDVIGEANETRTENLRLC